MNIQKLIFFHRAQNDSETRRAKLETKKLHDALMAHSKIPIKKDCSEKSSSGGTITSGNTITAANTPRNHDTNVDIVNKLNQEIVLLKDTNKLLEDKFQVSE